MVRSRCLGRGRARHGGSKGDISLRSWVFSLKPDSVSWDKRRLGRQEGPGGGDGCMAVSAQVPLGWAAGWKAVRFKGCFTPMLNSPRTSL